MLEMQINLSNILSNIRKIKEITKKDVIPVVKSNAYCLGDVEVVSYLEENGLKYFAVVDVDEAKKLCNNKIKANILILNGVSIDDLDFVEDNSNIIVVINNYNDALLLASNPLERRLKVHLQIETGMNRAGIKTIEELKATIEILKVVNIDIEGIFTHFTSSKNRIKQEEIFKQYISLYKFKMIHCAASSTYAESKLGNYVRVGLGIYGYDFKNGFKQALSICAKPLVINSLKKGDTIGYDGIYEATENELIAVLPIGYYNGYRRSLTGFKVYANSKEYQVVGKVCMNHLFIKVDNTINTNTVFYILNEKVTVEEMAFYMNTISHEVLCMFNIKDKVYIK